MTYNTTGNYTWTDPATGQTYNVPAADGDADAVPRKSGHSAQSKATQLNLAGMANCAVRQHRAALSEPLDVSGGPAGGDASRIGAVPGAQHIVCRWR